MKVRRALGAVAIARLCVLAARVGAVVRACWALRNRVTIALTTTVIMTKTTTVIVAVGMVVTVGAIKHVPDETDGLCVHMRTAAGIKRDADRMPGRHAHDDLREQDEREHEADGKAVHGAVEGRGMYRPDLGAGQGGWSVRPRNRGSAYDRCMFTCNIDRQGRTIRIGIGVFLETIGVLLGVLWFLSWGPDWLIWPAAAVWVSGLFVLFEGFIGWCAVRGMGFKTPF